MLRSLAALCAVPPARLRRAHARATCAVRVSASTYLAELRIKVSNRLTGAAQGIGAHTEFSQDFALVDDLTVSFTPGFNVITGASGSGKSLLVRLR